MEKEIAYPAPNLADRLPGLVMPDYAGGSIVNLAASLALGMGGRAPEVAPLPALDPAHVAGFRNVILLVIDGLGQQFLAERATTSFLASKQHAVISSVFPSTTATAITSLATALSPQRHAITGWFMYLRDIDSVTAILPFRPRQNGEFPDQPQYEPAHHYRFSSMLGGLGRGKYVVNDARIVDSAYSLATSDDAVRVPYHDLSGMMHCIRSIVSKDEAEKYLYVYWPEFDATCHLSGAGSDAALRHFHEVDSAVRALAQSLAGSDTLLIVTADHGFVDTAPDRLLRLEDHPRLQDMLRLPLCGEPRAAYCYLQPGTGPAFVEYVQSHLAEVCACVSREELLAAGMFGGGEIVHRDLRDRVGDYVLLAKDNWVIKDRMDGEKAFSQVGVHGGVSAAEMFVPLVLVDCRIPASAG